MLKWAATLLVLATAIGCFSALGVGISVLAKLFVALFLMSSVSFLIAWPFLRKGSSK
jgi:hypothetical protein